MQCRLMLSVLCCGKAPGQRKQKGLINADLNGYCLLDFSDLSVFSFQDFILTKKNQRKRHVG